MGANQATFLYRKSTAVECVAGRGLRGDRFFDYKDDYKGQVTFFAQETFDELSAAFPQVEKSPGVLRRNVIVSGVDFIALIGQEFELQGVRFRGTAALQAVPLDEPRLRARRRGVLNKKAGLRAKILTDGWLKTGVAYVGVSLQRRSSCRRQIAPHGSR